MTQKNNNSLIDNYNCQQTEIEISKIRPSKYNTYETEDIEDLIGSIKSFGLISPISVIGPDKEGMYYVLSGERRLKATTTIHEEDNEKFNKLPCYVCGSFEMAKEEQILIIESANLEVRHNFNVQEHRFNVIKVLHDMADNGVIKHHNIVREAQKYLGMSDRYRRMYLAIFKSEDAELKQMVNDEKISISYASRLVNQDEDVRKNALDKIKNGENQIHAVNNAISPTDNSQKYNHTHVSHIYEPQDDIFEEEKKYDKDEMGFEEYPDFKQEIINEGTIFDDIDGIEDLDDDEILNAFNSLSKRDNVNMSVDSVNEYKEMLARNDTSPIKKSFTDKLIEWCERMIMKDKLNNYEREICEKLKEVLAKHGFI